MPDNIRIQVKYTLKDIRAFSFAKAYARTIDQIMFGFCMLMALAFAFFFFFILLSGESIRFIENSVFACLILLAIAIFPGLFQYLNQWYGFNKNKLISIMQCFEFQEEGMIISSAKGNFKLPWRDIFKVWETKPCFIIYSSPLKHYLVPKRCLHSQEELTALRQMIIEKVDPKKHKLKKTRLGKIAPDDEPAVNPQPIDTLNGESNDSLLMKINFQLTQQDLLGFNFQYYYTNPSGLLLTVVGIFLTVFSLLKTGGFSFDLFIFGLMLVVVAPVIIYFNVNRQFKHDASLKRTYSFSFFHDYFILNHPNGQSRLLWTDLLKVKEYKKGFLLFLSNRLAYFIPKREFTDNAESERFRQIIKTRAL